MGEHASQESGGDLEAKLNSLFASYRNAIPDPEPGSGFMPRLWREIDARRSSVFAFRRWSQALVTAAVGISLLLGILLTVSHWQTAVFYGSTYLEALAQDSPAEADGYFELVSADSGGSGYQ